MLALLDDTWTAGQTAKKIKKTFTGRRKISTVGQTFSHTNHHNHVTYHTTLCSKTKSRTQNNKIKKQPHLLTVLHNLEKQPFWKTSVCYHISCFTLTGSTSAHCTSFSWSHSSNHHQMQPTQSKLEDAYITRQSHQGFWFTGKKTLISDL